VQLSITILVLDEKLRQKVSWICLGRGIARLETARDDINTLTVEMDDHVVRHSGTKVKNESLICDELVFVCEAAARSVVRHVLQF